MNRRVLIPFALFVVAGAVAPPVFAQAAPPSPPEKPLTPAELPKRNANFSWDKSLLRASFSYRDVVDAALLRKLSSGLPTVVAMRAFVLEEGKTEPIALTVRTCRVVYDLWDEVYRIKLTATGGERDIAVLNVEGVLRQCVEARDLPVVDRPLLRPATPHYLGVIVDVNPVSPAMLEQMRRWVSRPMGSTGITSGDALFGSFVGLFVRSIGASDVTLRFRTQTFLP
jgi:hypothetical protein